MNNGWHLERFNTLMMILAVTGFCLWPATGYNQGPLLRATANDVWHFVTFDILWHLTLRDIFDFMSFSISCHMRFHVIWDFMSFEISCHLRFHVISHFLTFVSSLNFYLLVFLYLSLFPFLSLYLSLNPQDCDVIWCGVGLKGAAAEPELVVPEKSQVRADRSLRTTGTGRSTVARFCSVLGPVLYLVLYWP